VFTKDLGIYHESRPLTPKLEISDRVRLHVVFVCCVHSATSAVLVVVGDGRSGDPLHERDDKRDVYEGEVLEVDTVFTKTEVKHNTYTMKSRMGILWEFCGTLFCGTHY